MGLPIAPTIVAAHGGFDVGGQVAILLGISLKTVKARGRM